MKVTIEIFGVLRLRAGTACLAVEAATVGEALTVLGQKLPSFQGSVLRGESLAPAYRLSLNARQFVDDPMTPLADGDALLLLAADAGG